MCDPAASRHRGEFTQPQRFLFTSQGVVSDTVILFHLYNTILKLLPDRWHIKISDQWEGTLLCMHHPWSNECIIRKQQRKGHQTNSVVNSITYALVTNNNQHCKFEFSRRSKMFDIYLAAKEGKKANIEVELPTSP